ncbi:MAG: ATP-binding protein, partial [Carboxylicivirga sp.]|nr:ATP-binding protein [Carboxylicivirga sp.]
GTNMNGLNKYIADQESFISYKFKSPKNGLAGTSVVAIDQLQNGLLITGTTNGIFLFNKRTLAYTNLQHNTNDTHSLVHNDVKSIHVDHTGTAWIGTVGGLSKMNPDQQTFTNYKHLPDDANSLGHDCVMSIAQTADSILWFGTTNGLNRLNINTNQIIRYHHELNNTNSIIDDVIHSMETDRNGDLWVGTTKGLTKIVDPNARHHQYIHYYNDPSDLNSLSGNKVKDLYLDQENIMWAGTINDGVSQCYLGQYMFNNEKHSTLKPGTLSHDEIRCLFEDSQQNLWVGTDGGGLNFKAHIKQEYIRFDELNNGITVFGDKRILDVFESKSGDIWVGTWGGGASKFSMNDIHLLKKGILPTIQHFNFDNANTDGIAGDVVQDIFQDSYNNIWLGTENGISIYNPLTHKFTSIAHKPDKPMSLCDNRIQSGCIIEDKEHNIWIGTWNGISILRRENIPFRNGILPEDADASVEDMQFEHFLYKADEQYSFGDNRIISLLEDKDGTMWVGTFGGGLSKVKLQNGKFIVETYTVDDGLPDNVIYGIEKGGDNQIWLSSNNGLSCFNHRDNTFTNFGKGDGVQGDEFYWGAHLSRVNGQLVFGGINGFTSFYPDSIFSRQINKPVISGMSIFNVPVNFKNRNTPLEKPMELTKEIVLSHKDKVVSFDYTSLDFHHGKDIHFSYILEGFEDSWNHVGTRRTAIYTNLEPGDYVFKVKIGDNAEEDPDAITSLNIKIKTPYYKTLWFRSSLVFLLTSIIFLIYRLKLRQVERQKKQLEAKVNERTKELSETNRLLVYKNEEIVIQRDRIITQNKELQQHREGLEQLVQARTKELVLAKNKAEESDQLKSAFLANMSHEIRTPLNAVVGFSNLLNDKDIDDKNREQFVKQINQNTDDLLVLIDDILDLSHIEAKQLTIRSKVVELNSFFKSISEIYTDKSPNLNFKVLNNCSDLNLVVKTDPQRVRQILINLLNNAFKFTEEGFIEFTLTKQENHILFYVKDSGIGISEENQEFIFDRFRKLQANASKLYRGTGLGLTISKKLAELLNADLYLESVLGEGATFYLKLPLNPKQ